MAAIMLLMACRRTPTTEGRPLCDAIAYDESKAHFSFVHRRGERPDARVPIDSTRLVLKARPMPGTYDIGPVLRVRTRRVDSAQILTARTQPTSDFQWLPMLWRDRLRDSSDWVADLPIDSAVIVRPGGLHAIRFACVTCPPSDTVFEFRAGFTDTLDIAVTGFPNNCEVERDRRKRRVAP